MRYLKYIKVFESQDQTSRICKKFGIKNWSINDGLVDVNGNVDFRYKELKKIPLKFGSVSGDFSCSWNQLTSLEGAPKSVEGGFYCWGNQLTSLEGAPERVGGDFDCRFNPVLTSFDWVPKRLPTWKIEMPLGYFSCQGSPIWNIWNLFEDWEELDFFDECDPIRGSSIDLNRLNYFLETIGKEPVQTVEGYSILN